MNAERWKNMIFVTSIIVALIWWIVESIAHYTIFDVGAALTFFPGDANELWMRSIITVLIIVMGAFLQRAVNNLIQLNEQKLEIEKHAHELDAQKLDTLKTTMRTVQDIVGNAMNHLMYCRVKAEESSELSNEILEDLDKIIFDTTDKLNRLASVKVFKKKKIGADLYTIDIELDDEEGEKPAGLDRVD